VFTAQFSVMHFLRDFIEGVAAVIHVYRLRIAENTSGNSFEPSSLDSRGWK